MLFEMRYVGFEREVHQYLGAAGHLRIQVLLIEEADRDPFFRINPGVDGLQFFFIGQTRLFPWNGFRRKSIFIRRLSENLVKRVARDCERRGEYKKSVS